MNAAMEATIVTLMRIAPTLMAHIAAPVRKDTLEKESCQGKIRLDFEKSRLTVYHK